VNRREGDAVPFNRINGFYVGNWSLKEATHMTLDERNDEVNAALEARFSQLSAAITAQEAKLKSMGVFRDASLVYAGDADFDPDAGFQTGQHQFLIGMIKLQGEWRLCHGYQYEDERGEVVAEPDWKPLVEASIDERFDAIEFIDDLRTAIVESKEQLIPSVERAVAHLARANGD